MAVSCTDYPQLFSLAATPEQRRRQLATAAAHPPPGDPFAPFTVSEWLTTSAYSEPYAACLDWPAPKRVVPAVPPKAPPPLPASVPLLVIGGDLDSLTPLSDAKQFAPKHPLDLADAAQATVVSGPDPGAETRRAVTVAAAAGALADATIAATTPAPDAARGCAAAASRPPAVRLDWTQRSRLARARVGATRFELAAP